MALCWFGRNHTTTYMGGARHILSNCLLICGSGVWLGTCGVLVQMSCINESMFCCFFFLHNFVFGGRFLIPLDGPC